MESLVKPIVLQTMLELPPGDWMLLETWIFYVVFMFAIGFFALLLGDFILFYGLGVGKHMRTFLSAWIKKKTIDAEATDDGVIDFIPRKMTPEGALISERKYQGVTYTEVKFVPPRSNPIGGKRYIIRGTGIPLFLSHAGVSLASNPDLLALLSVVEQKDEAILDSGIQTWLNKMSENLPKKVVKEIQEALEKKSKRKRKKKPVVVRKLLTLIPEKLEDFFAKKNVFRTGQLHILLKREFLRGQQSRGQVNWKPIFIVLLVLGVVGVALMFALPILESMGGMA